MRKLQIDNVLKQGHSSMNEVVMDTAGLLKDAYLVTKIDDLLKERGLSQKELAHMTGMRVGTISEWVNGKGISINKVQLLSLMVALKVTKISDIIEIVLPEQQEKEFEEIRNEWITDKKMPIPVKELYRDNVLKASGLKD